MLRFRAHKGGKIDDTHNTFLQGQTTLLCSLTTFIATCVCVVRAHVKIASERYRAFAIESFLFLHLLASAPLLMSAVAYT